MPDESAHAHPSNGLPEPHGEVVLIVEDDDLLASTLSLILRGSGYRTEVARDGIRALELWRSARPDLILLDLGLPRLDGRSVLQRIRQDSDVPVVILTARAEEADELDGLGLGADAYLVKPVTRDRLLAHVGTVLRRVHGRSTAPEGLLRVGRLEVDRYRKEVRVDGSPVHLTPTEFALLEHLAETPERAVTRTELYEAALSDSDAYDRAVDVHVANLRRKLRAVDADGLVETVRGTGYRVRGGTA